MKNLHYYKRSGKGYTFGQTVHGQGPPEEPSGPPIDNTNHVDGVADASSNTIQRRGIHFDPSLVYDIKLAHSIMTGRSSGPSCRPDFGTRGRTVQLRANHFPVHSVPDALYEYHVGISPDTLLWSHVIKRIFQLAEQTTAWEQAGMVGTVAHDGASRIISLDPLPHPLEIQVHYYEEGASPASQNARTYTLTIKFVKVLDMGNLIGYIQGRPGFRNHNISSAVSALNLVQLAARGDALRRPHLLNTQTTALGGGFEVQRGFRMTICPTRGQLTIRVNLTATPFYTPGNLATWMTNFQSSTSLRLDGFRCQMVVETTHVQTRKRVTRFATQNCNATIETPDFGQVSAKDFFYRRYGIKLEFPHLPLVEFGNQSKILLPPEVCTILPDQQFRKKLPDAQESAMLSVARVSPSANGHVTRQLWQQPVGPILSSSGMAISPDPLEVRGRILPKPSIIYATKTTSVNDRGQWDLRDAKFIVGARLDRWAVLLIREGYSGFTDITDPGLREAVSAFQDMCNAKGMEIARDPVYAAVAPSITDLREGQAITTIKAKLLQIKPKPQAVLVVLASKGRLIYQDVKYLCDVDLDVTTLCVLPSKFRASRSPYLSSLALKFNMKLGGVNHSLDAESVAWLNTEPTMVVGIDVLGPAPGDFTGMPSIAAVVASVDEYFAQYPATLSLQSLGQDMVTDLDAMMIERLNYYQNQNEGKLPKRILLYRNSIPESQFGTLLSIEVPRIRAAFQSFDTTEAAYKPKLTLVVYCRSQRTWFWVDGVDKGNPEPGTVVDCGVTSAYNFDFYLQAHGDVAGTARPTLYTVVYNEMGATADEIQGVTHALSYMYAPATHAVSLAAPAHYASLACKRGRCYLPKMFEGYGDMSEPEAAWAIEEVKSMGGIPGWDLSSSMYYI